MQTLQFYSEILVDKDSYICSEYTQKWLNIFKIFLQNKTMIWVMAINALLYLSPSTSQILMDFPSSYASEEPYTKREPFEQPDSLANIFRTTTAPAIYPEAVQTHTYYLSKPSSQIYERETIPPNQYDAETTQPENYETEAKTRQQVQYETEHTVPVQYDIEGPPTVRFEGEGKTPVYYETQYEIVSTMPVRYDIITTMPAGYEIESTIPVQYGIEVSPTYVIGSEASQTLNIEIEPSIVSIASIYPDDETTSIYPQSPVEFGTTPTIRSPADYTATLSFQTGWTPSIDFQTETSSNNFETYTTLQTSLVNDSTTTTIETTDPNEQYYTYFNASPYSPVYIDPTHYRNLMSPSPWQKMVPNYWDQTTADLIADGDTTDTIVYFQTASPSQIHLKDDQNSSSIPVKINDSFYNEVIRPIWEQTHTTDEVYIPFETSTKATLVPNPNVPSGTHHTQIGPATTTASMNTVQTPARHKEREHWRGKLTNYWDRGTMAAMSNIKEESREEFGYVKAFTLSPIATNAISYRPVLEHKPLHSWHDGMNLFDDNSPSNNLNIQTYTNEKNAYKNDIISSPPTYPTMSDLRTSVNNAGTDAWDELPTFWEHSPRLVWTGKGDSHMKTYPLPTDTGAMTDYNFEVGSNLSAISLRTSTTTEYNLWTYLERRSDQLFSNDHVNRRMNREKIAPIRIRPTINPNKLRRANGNMPFTSLVFNVQDILYQQGDF